MVDQQPTALSSAIRTLLRPLVRILLRRGIPYRVLAEHAKRAYTEIASEDFRVSGRKPSQSRISIITGLTRKEVARLTGLADDDPGATANQYNRAARVVTGWIRDKQFADGRGRPAALPLGEKRRSFAELVRRYGGDVPTRAVLDELLRVGAVSRLKDGRIKLVSRAYVPQSDDDEKIGILGRDVADLIATIDHNLSEPPATAYFQRKVAYDNLPEESLASIRKHAGKRAQVLLEQLDRLMSEQDRDTNPTAQGAGKKRAMLGIYYFEEDAEE